MIIDTTKVKALNSFSRLESLKEVYGLIWLLVPIFTPILGITIGVIKALNYFSRLESLKEVYGLIWLLVPIFTPVSGIIIGVIVIVWLEKKISVGIQQCIGLKYAGPLGILQALANGTKLIFKENLLSYRGDPRLFSIRPSTIVISVLLSYSVIGLISTTKKLFRGSPRR